MPAQRREAWMDADLVAVLARLAGLERALAAFPDDVYAAAAQALAHREDMQATMDQTAEPWPPMRAGTGL
jgi:hypothetical protein